MRERSRPVLWSFRCVLIGLYVIGSFFSMSAHAQIKKEVLKDGVEHWYIQENAQSDAYLARKFTEIYNIILSPQSARPFGRSIAFLVGVSQYRYLSPLPSVLNDVGEMRDFLLNKAGFDEVYVATDAIVNRDLIEQYVKDVLPGKMQKDDRLLFYYSGHGGDNQGQTGYMLFANAEKGHFYGQYVLAVDSLNDWSRELPIRHALFILDSCSSGLGIVAKSGASDSDALLLRTLSGNGSRTVLTAGTADEETYAEENRQRAGHSIFTKALLDAFDSSSLSESGGFITIDELFADIQKEMAQFRAASGKSTTPRMWPLQVFDYQGTFVFLNLRATAARLTQEQAKVLKVVPKAEGNGPAASESGIIEVSSAVGGELSIDGQDMGYIRSGETRGFGRQPVGLHKVQFRMGMTEPEEKDAVLSGSFVYISFGLKSPIDQSGSGPVGALEVRSPHGLSGEVLIDDFPVGVLEQDGSLTISNIKAGQHVYRIVGARQTEALPIQIEPNETAHVALQPLPPTNLKLTLQ